MTNLRKLYADNRRQAERRFEVRAAADGGTAEVFLYDAIVADPLEAEFFGGVAPEPFVKALRSLNVGTINLRINSPGGSVFAGRAIEQALRDHPAKVIAHVDGVAASAAAFIAMGADEVVMGKGALMMIHKAWSLAYGNADDLISAAALLEKIDSTQVQTFVDRTGQSAEQVNEWLSAETWFTADEAVAAGFADRVAETAPKAQARWDLSAYAHAPQLPAEPAPPEPDRVDASALLRRLAVAALTD